MPPMFYFLIPASMVSQFGDCFHRVGRKTHHVLQYHGKVCEVSTGGGKAKERFVKDCRESFLELSPPDVLVSETFDMDAEFSRMYPDVRGLRRFHGFVE
jgi:hypothetical protein